MKKTSPIAHATKNAIRRLRMVLFFVLLGVLLPLVLILGRFYRQLEDTAFLRLQGEAQTITRAMNDKLFELLDPEERRPFDQYSFLSLSESKLVQQKALAYSPLSEIPPRTTFPGAIGYFQVNPDSSLQFPFLPETEAANVAGLSAEELKKRQKMRDELRKYLAPDNTSPSTGNSAMIASIAGANDESNSRKSSVESSSRAVTNLVSDLFWSDSVQREQTAKMEDDFVAQNFDSRQYVRNESKMNQERQGLSNYGNSRTESVYKSKRKETVSLPQQNQLLEKDLLEQRQVQQPRALLAQSDKQDTTANPLLTFEGEIDPFKAKFLENTKIVLYRKIWRDKTRFVQGLVVERPALLDTLIDSSYSRSSLSTQATLTITEGASVLAKVQPKDVWSSARHPSSAESKQIFVYRSQLAAPLGNLELVFSVPQRALSSGELITHLLASSAILILLLGSITLYKLGVSQIILAQKKNDFVSSISHELRTPLTSIRMYSEMLKAGWVQDPEKQKTYYEFIFSESERLSRLISNVLRLAGLSGANSQLALADFEPQALLTLIETKVRAQVESAHFELKLEAGCEKESRLLIEVEEDAFLQIFINLVDNALKFSKDSETKAIVIGFNYGSGHEAQEVEFFVRDFGPGIPAQQQKKIFQLFYRVESELTRTTPGTGIGLALVKELVDSMGAKIDLVNQSPGVAFKVKFPAKTA